MSRELDFVKRFEAVEVPTTLRTIDEMGDNSEGDTSVRETIRGFFDRTVAAFELSHLAMQSCFEINTAMLIPSTEHTYSDDFIETLEIKDVQLIASAVRKRDEWNYQVTHFAKYPLTPRSVRVIKEFEMIEGIIQGRDL